jgi:hypothetical protein
MQEVATEERLKVGTDARDLLAQFRPRIQRFAYYAILLFCGISALRLAIEVGGGLPSLKEIGYGDSYIFYGAQQFVKTGQIYPDVHNHDVIPSLYSPFLYIVLSLPMRIGAWAGSYVGPRLMVLAWFLVCLGLVASISRKLTDCPWPVSVLLACSFWVFQGWIIQLRADFMSIGFALLAIRLLLEDRPWCYALAGAAAGFAVQFKITYISAGAAGFLWLLYQQKWKPLIVFTAMAALTSFGVYAVMRVREPYIFQNIFAMHAVVRDYSAVGHYLSRLTREPALLLGATMLPILVYRRWPQWTLPTLYLALSFASNALLSVQAGGNINYFFEGLLAITPFAAAGALWVRDHATGRVSVLIGLLIWGLGIDPLIPSTIEAAHVAKEVRVQNLYIQSLRRELAGKSVFSTTGWVSHLTETVAMPEPYLLSYLERGAKWDSDVWAAGIRQQKYDLVVTDLPQITFRSVPHVPPKIHVAIEEAYEPSHACPGILLFHRRGEIPDSGTTARFAAMGCRPVVCPSGAECKAW